MKVMCFLLSLQNYLRGRLVIDYNDDVSIAISQLYYDLKHTTIINGETKVVPMYSNYVSGVAA